VDQNFRFVPSGTISKNRQQMKTPPPSDGRFPAYTAERNGQIGEKLECESRVRASRVSYVERIKTPLYTIISGIMCIVQGRV